jgi:type I restriction enzyme S subunit
MLLLDLQGLLQISRARTKQASALRILEGWTLISCSGTIGRTAFVRREIAGHILSHDVIRAVPHDGDIKKGYLFAFLSSRQALAMIRQKTYGSVVQHIEPGHIADLPVPTPDSADEDNIDRLVCTAAEARTEAAMLLDAASAHFDSLGPHFTYTQEHQRAEGVITKVRPGRRLDAFHHVGWASQTNLSDGDHLGDLGPVSRPGMIKRVFVERGVPFISGVDVYQVRPPFRTRLMTLEAERANALVTAGQIVVQRSGQRYGLLGRPALIGRRLDGYAASDHLMRISPVSPEARARIFAFLRSELGRRSLLRTSYGTSIPTLNPDGLADQRVPALPLELVSAAERALQLREQADADEEQAIRQVEAWLDS